MPPCPASATAHTLRKVAEKQVGAINARDAHAPPPPYYDDALNWQVADDDPVARRQAILEELVSFYRAYPESFTWVKNLFEVGTWATLVE